jgi:ABC-type oligopeptide transport system ATPase subunit
MSDCTTHEEYSRKLKEKLKEKQERIAQERREREYQMLKDCTFKPNILDKEPSTLSTENVPVKGLARHLELKELKKK